MQGYGIINIIRLYFGIYLLDIKYNLEDIILNYFGIDLFIK